MEKFFVFLMGFWMILQSVDALSKGTEYISWYVSGIVAGSGTMLIVILEIVNKVRENK